MRAVLCCSSDRPREVLDGDELASVHDPAERSRRVPAHARPLVAGDQPAVLASLDVEPESPGRGAGRIRRHEDPEGDEVGVVAPASRQGVPWSAPRCVTPYQGVDQGLPGRKLRARRSGSGTACTRCANTLRRSVVPVDLPAPLSPVLLHHTEERASEFQNRVADKITTFAGSMAFVYLHVI